MGDQWTSSLAVLGLVGAIALFLWGTHMVQTGVQRALGPRLRRILGRTLSNRIKAFLAGIGADRCCCRSAPPPA